MRETVLNRPLTLKSGVTIPNRFAKAATSEQLGDRNRDPKPGLANLYGRWSDGGAGLLISGNIMIDRTALGEPHNVVLDADSDLALFRAWTKAGTRAGNQFWAQLNHPGKQSPKALSPTPVAPSATPLSGALAKAFSTPRALSEPEIEGLIARFASCAGLAKQVGFTGVQIHGAHGYLVSQFLSPKHNVREDRWGGSLENRMRFVLAVYAAVRAEVGDDFPVAIKLNSADFQRGGFTEEESMRVAEALVSAGIDHIEISGGSYESPTMVSGETGGEIKDSTRKREAYFLQYAESLRARVDVALAVTGGFRTAAGMEEAVASGATDMIGMARPMILEPDLPRLAIADANFVHEFKDPTTGYKAFDTMTMMPLIWYENQMWRMAKGQEPKRNLSPKGAALSAIWKMITKPSGPRRA